MAHESPALALQLSSMSIEAFLVQYHNRVMCSTIESSHPDAETFSRTLTGQLAVGPDSRHSQVTINDLVSGEL